MVDSKRLELQDRKILFFDGVCNLCNVFVSFLVERNVKKQIFFSSLQGKAAQEKLPRGLIDNLETVVFLEGKSLYVRSDAAIRVLMELGGGWRALSVLLYIPKPVRDFIYMLISRNRYSLFGKKETCRLPSSEEKEMFLD